MGLGVPAVVIADATRFEPGWLKIVQLKLAKGAVRQRFVHFSDIHFKGDADYLRRVVGTINDLKPDFACFTGFTGVKLASGWNSGRKGPRLPVKGTDDSSSSGCGASANPPS